MVVRAIRLGRSSRRGGHVGLMLRKEQLDLRNAPLPAGVMQRVASRLIRFDGGGALR